MCPYFGENQPVGMYRKFRNVPIFQDFPPICFRFQGWQVWHNKMESGIIIKPLVSVSQTRLSRMSVTVCFTH